MSYDYCFFFQLTISCTAIHFGKTRPFFAAGTGNDMKKWWFNWNLSWVHHYVAKDISSWAIVYFKVVTVMWKMLILKLLRVLARSPINPWNIEQVPLALNWNNNIPFNLSGDSKLELCLSWAYLNAKIVSSGYPDDEEKSISLKTCTRLFHNNM